MGWWSKGKTMGNTTSATAKALHTPHHQRARLLWGGVIVGLVAGVIISLYRLGIQAVAGVFRPLVERGHASWPDALLALAAFAGMGVVASLLLKWEPNISGSGIPQIMAQLSSRLDTKWYRVLTLKFLGGLCSLGGGLTMGREGPSVQIGGGHRAGRFGAVETPRG